MPADAEFGVLETNLFLLLDARAPRGKNGPGTGSYFPAWATLLPFGA